MFRPVRPVWLVAVTGASRKVRTLWQLPDGTGKLPDQCFQNAEHRRGASSTDEAIDELVTNFSGVRSRKTARGYLHVLVSLGFVQLDGPLPVITKRGCDFMSHKDPALVKKALIERIAGDDKLLKIVRRHPGRIGLLIHSFRPRATSRKPCSAA
jgi:hypothetical protein